MKHAKLGTINFACGCSADVSGIRPGIGDRVLQSRNRRFISFVKCKDVRRFGCLDEKNYGIHRRIGKNQTVAPWAVNLVVHRTNRRYEEDLKAIQKYKPPIVITSLGNPAPVVDVVHEYGGLVFSDVSTLPHAKKAASAGVDGLILVCSGAGGMAGRSTRLRSLVKCANFGTERRFWPEVFPTAAISWQPK